MINYCIILKGGLRIQFEELRNPDLIDELEESTDLLNKLYSVLAFSSFIFWLHLISIRLQFFLFPLTWFFFSLSLRILDICRPSQVNFLKISYFSWIIYIASFALYITIFRYHLTVLILYWPFPVLNHPLQGCFTEKFNEYCFKLGLFVLMQSRIYIVE